MKKIFTLSFAFLTVILLSSGCMNKNVDSTDIDETKNENEVEMFDGEINTFWNDAKSDYDEIELEAKRETEQIKDVTTDDIKSLEKTIETNYKKIKNGITKENEQEAKELYKAATKIELLAQKDGVSIDHELVTLSRNAKSLVRHYYGEADKDFSTVKNDFEQGIENVKNYTEDKWQDFVNMIR